jgi:dipeptidyl aminopeptidase/acylaminoacyl peptidase
MRPKSFPIAGDYIFIQPSCQKKKALFENLPRFRYITYSDQSRRTPMKKGLLMLFLMGSLITVPSSGQAPYKMPPKEVVDILDAPPFPRALPSPAGDLMLLADYQAMPRISDLAQPLLRVAGLRITPRINALQQLTFYTALSLVSLKDGKTRPIPLPEGIKMGYPRWSHDGRSIAFARYRDDGAEVWVVNAATAEAKALTTPILNSVLGFGFGWLPDNRRLLVHSILEGRGAAPQLPAVPIGPVIEESYGKVSKVATFQDLLKSPYDDALFDHYATSELLEVDAATGIARKIGSPGIFLSADFSPDGNFLLVHRIKKPFSHSVPFFQFAHTLEVWDKNGGIVKVLADLPAAEEVPLNGVPTGPRSPEWQPLRPATLVWAEALDGGDPEKEVPFRDRLLVLEAPFSPAAREVHKVQHRAAGLEWLSTPGNVLVSEYDWKRRWQTTTLVNIDNPQAGTRKIFDLSTQDDYADPGSVVMARTSSGETIALQDKDWVYLRGAGASPQGDRPFLDKMSLKTLEKKRLFACAEGKYESFIAFPGESRGRILISSESPSAPPNYYLSDLKSKKTTALTDFRDPAPQLTGLKKELIKYKRDDGVELSGTLYLPPGAAPGVRLPIVIWAYPLEYSDSRTAGQVRDSPYRFTFLRGSSQLFFVTQGYAVLDGAQMPVIGDPKTMNDTYVEQIVSNAKAAIDALDKMGVGDPRRVGVGGHSYGAFMTANLLAHCDLFAAGIARSGAYNRTLTPFGFQAERRTLWEARDTYINMSPFMHANKINEPILLIHGEADNNSGTFPIQSERLFSALKGFGGTARLVMLPHESHGYSARESILHVLAESFEWFDKYVKNRR